MKNKTCCFTGHRPNKLGWEDNENDINLLHKNKLEKEIKNAISEGYIYFISGMALGIDMLVAEVVLKLKEKYSDIKLECAPPCERQDLKWDYKNKLRYKNILNQADVITYVSKYYFNGCMQKRNKYMLDNSNLLIAVFNGKNGGTKQTICEAKKTNINIRLINI